MSLVLVDATLPSAALMACSVRGHLCLHLLEGLCVLRLCNRDVGLSGTYRLVVCGQLGLDLLNGLGVLGLRGRNIGLSGGDGLLVHGQLRLDLLDGLGVLGLCGWDVGLRRGHRRLVSGHLLLVGVHNCLLGRYCRLVGCAGRRRPGGGARRGRGRRGRARRYASDCGAVTPAINGLFLLVRRQGCRVGAEGRTVRHERCLGRLELLVGLGETLRVGNLCRLQAGLIRSQARLGGLDRATRLGRQVANSQPRSTSNWLGRKQGQPEPLGPTTRPGRELARRRLLSSASWPRQKPGSPRAAGTDALAWPTACELATFVDCKDASSDASVA